MEYYRTRIDEGTVYLETDDGELEIGELDDIIDVIGGETYTITYDKQQQTQSWLETSDDGEMSFDVRDTIEKVPHQQEVIEGLQATDRSKVRYGLPERTVEFADEIVSILEQQGTATRPE